MRESKIEKDSAKAASKLGWFSFKLVPTLFRGLPDKCFIGYGKVVFIEYKNEIGKLSPIQIKVHSMFAKYGITVHVCRSVEETLEVLNNA